MFVSFPDIAIRKPGSLIQHFIDELVQVVYVPGERISVFHARHGERQLLKICNKINTTMLARQCVFERLDKVHITRLFMGRRRNRIIEAHCMKIVPHTRPPYTGHHPIGASVVLFRKYSLLTITFAGTCFSSFIPHSY